MTCASLNVPSDRPFLSALEGPAGSRWRAYYLVLKGQAFRVVVLEPSVRSVGIREDLEVIWVPDPLARIHVNEHSHRGNPILPPGAAAPTNWEEPAKPRPLASGFGGMSRKLT